MPSCLPKGSSYCTPTQKPGPSDSARPTNFTTPLFAPGSTSHLDPTLIFLEIGNSRITEKQLKKIQCIEIYL